MKKIVPQGPFHLATSAKCCSTSLPLEHQAGDDTSNDESNTRTSRDARGTTSRSGGRSGWRGTSGSSSLADGRARSAASGGGEGSSDTISGLISVGNASSEGRKGPFASGWGIDGTVHTALAVLKKEIAKSQPPAKSRDRHDRKLTGFLAQKNQMGLAVWVTSRVKTPICPEAASYGIKPESKPFDWLTVLNCWVQGSTKQADTRDGVVTTAELKVDKIANGSVDDLWVEDETCSTSAVDTDGDSDKEIQKSEN
ncbi:10320_t:CDS:2 [Acaulospora colombiana]|uniref:10320_t:CDS:1 n=1 Tax=Acaulospora colombiana TaxID=27376 RepID=A0ACA9NAK9_9GLOM|nr:10320_t:CDS:2 [Acaulospora colombiana]